MRRVYMDHTAGMPVDERVLEVMMPYFTQNYGNPSSAHSYGNEARRAIDEARSKVAKLIGAKKKEEIIFTSGGTESNNLAIRGALEATPDKKHLVAAKVEHSSVLNVFHRMENLGYRLTLLDVDSEGLLDLDQLRDSLTDDTALVSLMHANNETGIFFPMGEIVDITKNRGIPLLVDAIQTVGKMPVDLGGKPVVDYATIVVY